MKKEYYLFLGYYMNLKIYYCTKNENLYADMEPNTSQMPLTAFAGVNTIIYVIGRNLRRNGSLPSIGFLNESLFSIGFLIRLFVITGIVLGIFFSKYIDKKNHEHFSKMKVFCIPDVKQKNDLIEQAKRITGKYIGFEISMIILALAELIILEKEIDIILFIGYIILWFGITYLGLQCRIFKRRKAIRSMREKGK